MPCSASTVSRPRSTQRLSIEYAGWWMTSGVPRSLAMAIASSVRSGEYDEMPTYVALPMRTAVSSAAIVSATGVSGSKRCE